MVVNATHRNATYCTTPQRAFWDSLSNEVSGCLGLYSCFSAKQPSVCEAPKPLHGAIHIRQRDHFYFFLMHFSCQLPFLST